MARADKTRTLRPFEYENVKKNLLWSNPITRKVLKEESKPGRNVKEVDVNMVKSLLNAKWTKDDLFVDFGCHQRKS